MGRARVRFGRRAGTRCRPSSPRTRGAAVDPASSPRALDEPGPRRARATRRSASPTACAAARSRSRTASRRSRARSCRASPCRRPRTRASSRASCGSENLPGEFPFTAGVFPFKRPEEEPARMFAGEGGPERTNRRFHMLAADQPATRLSTAFDSVTLYGRDPTSGPTSTARSARRASRSARSTTRRSSTRASTSAIRRRRSR